MMRGDLFPSRRLFNMGILPTLDSIRCYATTSYGGYSCLCMQEQVYGCIYERIYIYAYTNRPNYGSRLADLRYDDFNSALSNCKFHYYAYQRIYSVFNFLIMLRIFNAYSIWYACQYP